LPNACGQFDNFDPIANTDGNAQPFLNAYGSSDLTFNNDITAPFLNVCGPFNLSDDIALPSLDAYGNLDLTVNDDIALPSLDAYGNLDLMVNDDIALPLPDGCGDFDSTVNHNNTLPPLDVYHNFGQTVNTDDAAFSVVPFAAVKPDVCAQSTQIVSEEPTRLVAHDFLPINAADHLQVQPLVPNSCHECKECFHSKAELHRHARAKQHSAYVCKCAETFSRLDVLKRHLDRFRPETPRYPCLRCKRHRGDKDFTRKEHLQQHLRGYHHVEVEVNTSSLHRSTCQICPHPDCPQYRGPEFLQLRRGEQKKQKPFASQAEYTKHIRDVHDESPFPCDIPDCKKVGGRGYFREKDLLKHRKDQHPEAPLYVVAERHVLYSCQEPNCKRTGNNGFRDPWGLVSHYDRHGYKRHDSHRLAGYWPSWKVKHDMELGNRLQN
jgi:hypothetical protein